MTETMTDIDKKLEKLLTKERKWTAKDAGRFVFAAIEKKYRQEQPAAEEQWDRFQQRAGSELSEDQLKKYRIYESMYLRIDDYYEWLMMQVEGLNRGIEYCINLLEEVSAVEQLEKILALSPDAIEVWKRDAGPFADKDPFANLNDVSNMMETGGLDFNSYASGRIRPALTFAYAWDAYYRTLADVYGLKNEITFCCLNFDGTLADIDKINRYIEALSDAKNLSDHGKPARDKAAYIRRHIRPINTNGLKARQDRKSKIRELLTDKKWDDDMDVYLYEHTRGMIYYLEGRDIIL